MTGGAAGLGRAFAIGLAEAGHDVAILDVQPSNVVREHVESLGRQVVTSVGDAADPSAVAAFGAKIRSSSLSPIRVLVNNAGISPYSPFSDTDIDLWRRILAVNLDSLFLMSKEFLPDLESHGRGRIVNLTSSVVWDAEARNMTAYATSKAAIVGFTRSLAGEVGHSGLTVNCIAPGIVLTPDIRERVSTERLETYRSRQSIPILAEAQDLLSTLLYLVAEESAQVTGAIMPVNGGRVLI